MNEKSWLQVLGSCSDNRKSKIENGRLHNLDLIRSDEAEVPTVHFFCCSCEDCFGCSAIDCLVDRLRIHLL